jgi:hypothetical protein
MPTQTSSRSGLTLDMTLDTALLLDILDEPIVFHRSYVPIAGGITAALFLSYAGYAYEDLPKERDGWFTRTQTEWERDTGLTRREQETARRLLRERGLLEERRVGMPAVLWYRVNWARLREGLEHQSRKNWAGRLGE